MPTHIFTEGLHKGQTLEIEERTIKFWMSDIFPGLSREETIERIISYYPIDASPEGVLRIQKLTKEIEEASP